jgi:flagellin
MPLSINTNLASMTAQRSFLNSNSALETAFERLSTGKRVNSAADDAAGLAIGKDLESRVNGLNQAIRNVNDGISMVQITEGTLDEVTTILQRMRDLAVQASNASLSSTERGYLDAEQAKLATTLGSVIDQSQFNGTDLVDDTNGKVFHIHAGADAGDAIDVSISAMTETILGVTASAIDLTNATGTEESVDLGLSAYGGTNASTTFTLTVGSETYVTSALDYSTGGMTAAQKQDALVSALTAATGTTSGQTLAQDLGITVSEKTEGGDITLTYADKENVAEATYSLTVTNSGATTGTAAITNGSNTARTAITTIDSALGIVASERAKLGATQAQLESTVRNLANVAENTSAAAGRIMDTDYAAETANLTKAQILQQAATSILAQANAQPQAVLSLLQ